MQLNPQILLKGYSIGIFPMADPRRGDRVSWYAPDPRAILPLDGFRVSKNLARLVRRRTFDVRTDTEFETVMRACADRRSTWISDGLIRAYTQLHELGHAHSVETWQNGELVGGLYGVTLGSAFFGESMFHRVSNASKVALVHLVRRLRAGGFTLLDTQYTTRHLEQFGVTEISRTEYERRLRKAVARPATWWPEPMNTADD